MADVFAGLPCTDVDVAAYALADFAIAAAHCEAVTSGEDGAIGAASFTLTSAVPFAARGVQPGHVLVIAGVNGVNATTGKPQFYPTPDTLPVASAVDGTLTLQRIGYQSGQGKLPAGVTETTGVSGLRFFVPSLVALIVTESADVLRRLQIVTDSSAVTDEISINPTDYKMLTIKSVLRSLYFAAARQAENDAFLKKSQELRVEIDARLKDLSRRDVLSAPSAGSTGTGFAASEFLWGMRRPDCGPWDW